MLLLNKQKDIDYHSPHLLKFVCVILNENNCLGWKSTVSHSKGLQLQLPQFYSKLVNILLQPLHFASLEKTLLAWFTYWSIKSSPRFSINPQSKTTRQLYLLQSVPESLRSNGRFAHISISRPVICNELGPNWPEFKSTKTYKSWSNAQHYWEYPL